MPLTDYEPGEESILTPLGFTTLPAPVEERKVVEETVAPKKEDEGLSWVQSAALSAATMFNPAAGLATYLASKPVVGAAFRTENTIGSAIAEAHDTWGVSNDLADPDYSAWDEVAGTKYEPYWRGTFLRSNNKAFTAALKSSIDRQEEDRREVAAGGFGGTVAAILAGTIDPTLLIPVGGEISLAGKGVWRVGKGALAGARAGTLGVAAQEGLLQATQDVRTAEESLLNIGTGTVLGAVLGGTAAGVLGRTQMVSSGEALERLQTIEAPTFGDAGAAAASQATINDLTVSGKLTETLAAGTAFSPNIRGNFRESPLLRQTYQEISSNPLFLNMHEEGRTLGGSVRDNIEVSLAETLGRGAEGHIEIYQKAKKAVEFGMTADAFDDAVSRAMRRDDVGGNDAVSAAAKNWRERVIKPLSAQAQKEGMLPDDLEVKEADSYFTRVYNREAMVQNRPVFMNKAVDYLNKTIKQSYAKGADKLRERIASLEQQAKDLSLSPEDRTTNLEELTAYVAQLEEAMPKETALKTRINEAQGKVRAAKTPEEKAAAKEALQSLRDSGGDDFKTYQKELDKITRRRKALNFNVPGLAEKTAKLEESIESAAETNQRALTRILVRGQKLAKELKKFDEEKLAETISDLRTQFHQLIENSNAAQDKLAQQLAKFKDLPAEQAKRLEAARAKEVSRMERLNALDERLQVAEGLDYKASVAEIRAGIDEMIKEISAKTLTRGEKVAAWKERMAQLDPKKVEERLALVEQSKKDLLRDFADKWEIKRLGKNVDPLDKEAEVDFTEHVKDLATDFYNRIVGNDYGSDVVEHEFRLPFAYGPLKDRTFHIPDADIEDFLENDVVKVMSIFSRRMSAQIELKKKFGDINMQERIKEIEKQYDLLEEAATTPEARTKISEDRKNGLRDIRAMRDQYLGTYLGEENASNWGRVVRGLMNVNYFRVMGGAAIPSISEVYAPVIAHGLGRYMTGWKTLLTNADAMGKLTKESKYSVVAEGLLHTRLMTMAELADPLAKGNAVERFLENATHVASKWNGLNLLTDFEKNLSSIITQDHLNEAILKGNDKRFLAWAGIDENMADIIKGHIKKHGETIQGVTVANTDQWGEGAFDAVRAYRVAIQKSVSTDIVTRKVGDVPLGFLRPTARLFLQFKTFSLAAHSQMFLRATQMGQARFLSSLIGLTTLGMFAATLRAWRGGEESWKKYKTSMENPGYWIAEGVDNTGMFTLPLELGNIAETVGGAGGYRVNPVKTPLLLGGKLINPDASLQGNSQRFNSMGSLDALGGPTVGMLRSGSIALGGALDMAQGEDLTLRQKRAASQLVPYQSYIGMREFLQLMQDDSPYRSEEPY